MDKKVFDETEDILYDYMAMRLRVENLEVYIEKVKEDLTGCVAISYKDGGNAINKFVSSVENELISKESYINMLERKINFQKDLVYKISGALEILSERDYDIIKYRYFKKLKTWELVGEKVGLTADYCSIEGKRVVNTIAKTIFPEKFLKNSEII